MTKETCWCYAVTATAVITAGVAAAYLSGIFSRPRKNSASWTLRFWPRSRIGWAYLKTLHYFQTGPKRPERTTDE